MTLHGNPVFETARLPDGREARVRVGMAEDSYIPEQQTRTVVLEVRVGRTVEAVIDTILEPEQEIEARHLAQRVAEGLTSGDLQPTTSSVERLADEIV